MTITIRASLDADLPAIRDIYAHAVAFGTASFELEPPDLAEMARRRETLLAGGFPYLVAVLSDDLAGPEAGPAAPATRVVGYAYAGPYRPRPAYRNTLEDSIYIAPDMGGQGIGRRLLDALVAEGTRRGFRQMIAVIGDSANHASIRLHAAAGFDMIGTLRAVGFKHGRWLDSVLMQKPLGEAATAAGA
ncbi:MAG: N-acetyltransferase [Hyphomicrobiaceae bacterium]|nr:N-acetyltransferase [Hyphomicrobiaceae bacterium]